MHDLESVITELIRTSRPWDGERYDRSCHSNNLLEIATRALLRGLFDQHLLEEVKNLVDKLIVEFETVGFNNWQAHNNFCSGLFDTINDFRKRVVETKANTQPIVNMV